MKRQFCGSFLLLTILFVVFPSGLDAQSTEQRTIRNLKAFAKLYGYVRFFHPSDESANLDWDKFAVAGVGGVLKCKDDIELRETLKNLYMPIAPTMHIFNDERENNIKSAINSKDTAGLNVVAWQHYGVWLTENSNTYRSYRVLKNAELTNSPDRENINTIDRRPRSIKLFKEYPKNGDAVFSILCEKMFCVIPLTLNVDSTGTKGKNKDYPLQPLLDIISSIDISDLTADDLRIRLADIIIAWNVYEHFYPYFDVVKVDWDKVLPVSLSEALNDKTGYDFYFTLRRMVAKLQDGHGYVSGANYQLNYLPVRINLIENKIIVTASLDENVKVGSILVSIDGKQAEKELIEKEELVSGSPYLIKGEALLEIGSSFSKEDAELIIREGDLEKRISVKRIPNRWILEYEHDPIFKIEDGIYYLNINYADNEQFALFLPELKNAKGIIFDLRFTARPRGSKERISLWSDILWRMTDYGLQSAKWCIPEIIYPNRQNITFLEKTWTAQPYPVYFKSAKAFITDCFDISHMETFMGIVEYYKLGDIVGAPTAGANGNANYFPLPGGLQTGFTGMRVLKQDGSQHHLIGIKPNYPVERTIKAVKEGRDEYLEKAIEVLKNKIK